MSMRHLGVTFLAVAVLAEATGCQSREALETKRAFVAATYEKQLAAPPKPWAELRLDLDRALREDVELVRARAEEKIEGNIRTYRLIYMLAGGLAVAGSLKGSSSESGQGGWAITGGGVGVALAGYAAQRLASRKSEACRAFLAQAGDELRDWGKENLEGPGEDAPPEVARELYRRIYVIRAEPRCLSVR